MDDLERLMIERACERLMIEYCHFVDHGEASRIAGQFTEDGVWTSPETTMSGRAELEAASAAARRGAGVARAMSAAMR